MKIILVSVLLSRQDIQCLLYTGKFESVWKLDGVGSVDNRPSTDKLHHFVPKKMLYVICDTWHMTLVQWIFRNYLIFPESMKALGQTKCFQVIKKNSRHSGNFRLDFQKKKNSAKSWMFLACQASVFWKLLS